MLFSIILSKPFVFYVVGKLKHFGNRDTKESGLHAITVELTGQSLNF